LKEPVKPSRRVITRPGSSVGHLEEQLKAFRTMERPSNKTIPNTNCLKTSGNGNWIDLCMSDGNF